MSRKGNEPMKAVEGLVTQVLGSGAFCVDLGMARIIQAHLSGKLRMGLINIRPGDRVTIQMSPYDETWGRITGRINRKEEANHEQNDH